MALALALWVGHGDSRLAAATIEPEAALAAGKKLFEANCSGCHGAGGTGGNMGPKLDRPTLDRVSTREDIRDLIAKGVPDRMPGFGSLPQEEREALADFVLSLRPRTGAPGAALGDARAGHLIYQRSGCASCHIVQGQGGVLGPELTNIGQLRTIDDLREAIMAPGAKKRELPSLLVASQRWDFDGYVMMKVVTADGQTVEGMRLNEDTTTIQLRDREGGLHSFRKRELKSMTRQPGSPMPSYRARLTTQEFNDLLAYLASLRC
ncbi:MAG: c-type cytochrome [Caulobacter sp.]